MSLTKHFLPDIPNSIELIATISITTKLMIFASVDKKNTTSCTVQEEALFLTVPA